jgi:hypothetical protein
MSDRELRKRQRRHDLRTALLAPTDEEEEEEEEEEEDESGSNLRDEEDRHY